MRAGLWGARADRRGLAAQTTAAAKHLPFERVLGVDMTAGGDSPYPCDWTGYNQRVHVYTRAELTEQVWREWSDGLDVVAAWESWYLPQIPVWARQQNIRTVLYTNPEFHGYRLHDDPRPDLFIAPTSWLTDRLAPPWVVLPWPVDTDQFQWRGRGEAEPLTLLHVRGHGAANDRNGTMLFWSALRRVTAKCRAVIRSQGPVTLPRWRSKHVTLDVVVEDMPDAADLYTDGDVLVLPRRYGGLSLPVQEALACGLPALLPASAPHRAWVPDEGWLVAGRVRREQRTQNGNVGMYETFTDRLAAAMQTVVEDPGRVRAASSWAHGWAEDHSWEALGDEWWRAICGG